MMGLNKILRKIARAEPGIAFIETVVALALLGLVSVAFLSGLTTVSRASVIADEQTTAESLARSQMEWVKKAAYVLEAPGYTPAPVPGGDDYVGYSVSITADPLNTPDDGIQKIIVKIFRNGREVFQLDGHKVQR